MTAVTTNDGASTAYQGGASATSPFQSSRVHHRTATIDGVDVFYREAGPITAPVVLLLHGFPTSSQMFRDLIPRLADK